MTSAFDNLCGAGKPLKVELPDAREFAGLVRFATVRLEDAANPGLALESRFDLAYNAARRNGSHARDVSPLVLR